MVTRHATVLTPARVVSCVGQATSQTGMIAFAGASGNAEALLDIQLARTVTAGMNVDLSHYVHDLVDMRHFTVRMGGANGYRYHITKLQWEVTSVPPPAEFTSACEW